MATDDKVVELDSTTETTIEPVIEDKSEPVSPASPTATLTDEKINELINNKFKELTETYTKKVDELEKQLTEKNNEIDTLKKINQNIILTTNVDSKPKEITDFSTVDFDEVDWDEQASNYMGTIDAKIFS